MFNLEMSPTLLTYLQSIDFANIYSSGFWNGWNLYSITRQTLLLDSSIIFISDLIFFCNLLTYLFFITFIMFGQAKIKRWLT